MIRVVYGTYFGRFKTNRKKILEKVHDRKESVIGIYFLPHFYGQELIWCKEYEILQGQNKHQMCGRKWYLQHQWPGNKSMLVGRFSIFFGRNIKMASELF